jgi:glc operon protein GlcG
VFNNEIDDKVYGILKPDLIGWQGGLPVSLKSGDEISVGFSGFRGFIDVDIVTRAVELVESRK